MSNLHVYNTLTRQLEKYIPIDPSQTKMYVCGPTVYGDPHLGHAKSYISFDIIFRWLIESGYNPFYVQNITDVGHLLGDDNEGEDRILKKSRESKINPMAVAESYTKSYFDDMDILNVLRPHISPRATGHIPEQIEIIEDLVKKGYAYESKGSVYFDVLKFKEYGKLSGKKLDDLVAGARIEVNSEKKNASDFALWKKAEPNHLMHWKSPWSVGFPGWHIECSAMSMKYLGESFDIHGGGLENQFPHHECEIAQSEAHTGKLFVKYWLHNNMVTVNGVKMGKSLGNFTTIKDLVKRYDPMVIRFFILNSHYRSPIDFSDNALDAAKTGFERLQNTVRAILNSKVQSAEITNVIINSWLNEFTESMDDDFNTPRALAVLFNSFKTINGDPAFLVDFMPQIITFFDKTFVKVLGLDSSKVSSKGFDKEMDGAMKLIIDLRQEFRKERNWPKSDLIRDRLAEAGLVIEDGKDGSTWKIKS